MPDHHASAEAPETQLKAALEARVHEIRLEIGSRAMLLTVLRYLDSYWLVRQASGKYPDDPATEALLNLACGPLLLMASGERYPSEEALRGRWLHGIEDLASVAALIKELGWLARLRTALELQGEGIVLVEKHHDHVRIELREDYYPLEGLEISDYLWTVDELAACQASERRRLDRTSELLGPMFHPGEPMIGDALHWRNGRIEAIDNHFFDIALYEQQFYEGVDSFGPEDVIGGVRWRELTRVVAALASIAALQGQLVVARAKTSSPLFLLRDLPIAINSNELVDRIGRVSSVSAKHVWLVLNLLLSRDSPKRPFHLLEREPPLVVRATPETLLVGVFSCTARPFSDVAWRVRNLCSAEYDSAVDGRERRFIREVAALFSAPRFQVLCQPLRIRSGGSVRTDIDFVVVDSATGDTGLFQLKWQDAYGSSMRERRARHSNFNGSSRST